MWELLGSFSQTPTILLRKKDAGNINKGRRDKHLEGLTPCCIKVFQLEKHIIKLITIN